MSRFEVALAGVLLVAGTARALDITSCGVLMPPGEIGDLQADLSCPATSGFCVRDPSVSCTSSAECPPPPSSSRPTRERRSREGSRASSSGSPRESIEPSADGDASGEIGTMRVRSARRARCETR